MDEWMGWMDRWELVDKSVGIWLMDRWEGGWIDQCACTDRRMALRGPTLTSKHVSGPMPGFAAAEPRTGRAGKGRRVWWLHGVRVTNGWMDRL